MKISAHGVVIDLPEPSFPYVRPRNPSQSTQISSGRAIYTTTHADISPQSLDLTIRDITPEQHDALVDFILNVIEFSSYPCTVATDIDTHKNMHLMKGWETIADRRGDISNARLRFLESEQGITIGKNLLSVPRFFTDGGALSPEWSASGTRSNPILSASDAPFGYAQRVLRASRPFTLDLRIRDALPIVGTNIKIGAVYRRPPARITVRFYPTATAGASQISSLTVHNASGIDATGKWRTVSASVTEAQVPTNANFFTVQFSHPNTRSTLDLAEITAQYTL